MKYLFIIALIFLSIKLYSQDSFTYEYDDLTREYILYIPENTPDNAPLVFVLHGYTSNNNVIMGYCEMNAVADEEKFVVCYPQGTQDNLGTTHWNARLNISTTDDIGFLSELAGYLQSEYNLDPNRTFSCGMSNGGFMSYTLASEKSDVFKAIASVTGTMSGYSWENRENLNPIPVLQIHGIDDNVVPIDGSLTTLGGWGGAPHVDTIVNFWADLNECSEIDSSYPSDNTTFYKHSNGFNGNQVWYYKIENWGHNWPTTYAEGETGFIASEVIWEFFKNTNTTTGINEKEFVSFEIYPNPALQELFIKVNYSKPMSYQIFSILGQRLLYGKIQGNETIINLHNLYAGTYIFQLEGGENKILSIK